MSYKLEVVVDQKSMTGKQTPAGSGPHDHRGKEEVVHEDEVAADCVQIGVANFYNGRFVPEYIAPVRTSGRLLPNEAHLVMVMHYPSLDLFNTTVPQTKTLPRENVERTNQTGSQSLIELSCTAIFRVDAR